MNVISLKTSSLGTIYTCPAGTVAEIEMVAMEASSGGLDVVSNGITNSWVTTGNASLAKSFTKAFGSVSESAAAADNSFLEGGTYVLRPRFVRLTAGDTLNMTSARKCTLIIYEETTGTH